MKLYLAEKPSLGKEIAAALGGGEHKKTHIVANGWCVSWCFGHLYEQAKPEDYGFARFPGTLSDLPIIPQEWKLLPKDDAKSQITILRGLLDQASEVIHCGDPDREGQLLVDEVLTELNYRGQVYRAWLPSLVQSDIRDSLKKIKLNSDRMYQGMRNAAIARSRVDWLTGMNATRAYTIKARANGFDGVMSVGRVQSPTLGLIVRRHREIEAFEPVTHYGLKARFKHIDGIYTGYWCVPGEKQDAHGRLLDAFPADATRILIENRGGRIQKIETTDKKQGVPLPYSIDELQAHCSRIYGMGAAEVLTIAQSLYETHKVTTYPRTDCGYLASGQHAQAKAVFEAMGSYAPALYDLISKADVSRVSRAFDDTEITAHTAIIPTRKKPENLTVNEARVYDLIARRYIAQFLGDYQYQETIIETACTGHTFKTTGRMPRVLGWRAAYMDEPGDDEEENNDVAKLPCMKTNDAVVCVSSERETKTTKPPAAFTEGTLIKAMASIASFVDDPVAKEKLKETDGIGTSATRANIIEVLKKRAYIIIKGKSLHPTQNGLVFFDSLAPELTDAVSTAVLESALTDIETKGAAMDGVIASTLVSLHTLLDAVNHASMSGLSKGKKCPHCESGHLRLRTGKNGHFWGCSNYPDCEASYPNKAGKPDMSEPTTCPLCGSGELKQITGSYGKFWSCSRYPDCHAKFSDKRGKPDIEPPTPCPTCKEGTLKLRTGAKGKFWGCTRYPECRATFENARGKPKLK
jgi:DNA topoisomerase-3